MVKCVLFTFYVKLKYAEGPTDGTYSHHIFIRVECRFGIYNKSFEMATKSEKTAKRYHIRSLIHCINDINRCVMPAENSLQLRNYDVMLTDM